MPINLQRPRLLLTAAELPALKARAAVADPAWLAVQADALAAVNDPNRYGGTALIYNLALTWLVTGEGRYADRAIGLAFAQVNGGPASWASDSGYSSRDRLPALAVVYDWCHERLTPAQRVQLLAYMEGWVDWLWAGTVPLPGASLEALALQADYEHGRLALEQLEAINYFRDAPVHRLNFPQPHSAATALLSFLPSGAYAVKEPAANYFWGHWLGTLFTALTGAGDSLRTDALLNLANQKLALIRGYQQSAAAGGYLHEGTSYGMAGMLQNLFLGYAATATATGASPFDGWCKDAMLCKLAMTSPDARGVVPFGDQASDTKALFSDITRMGGLLYARFASDSVASVQNWLAAITPNTRRYYWYKWADFLYGSPSGLSFLPRGPHTARGAGYSVCRFGDVQHHFRCGTNQADHNDLAAGEIATVRGGDWLIALARQSSHSGIERTAEYANVLTVNGVGQGARNLVDQSLLPAATVLAEDGDGYAYRKGEAGATYITPSSSQLLPLLKSWERHDLCLADPPCRIIYDRAEPVDPAAVIKSHTTVLAEPGLNPAAGATMVTVGQSAMNSRSLYRAMEVVPLKLGPPGSTTITAWRQDQTLVGQPVRQALCVYQFGAVAFTPQPVTGDANVLRIGTLEIHLTGAPVPALWTTDAERFLFLGLAAGLLVHVGEGTGGTGQDVRASPAGVLSFKGQVRGLRAVTLSTGTLPPPPPGPTLKDAAETLSRLSDTVTERWHEAQKLHDDLGALLDTIDAEARRFEDAAGP